MNEDQNSQQQNDADKESPLADYFEGMTNHEMQGYERTIRRGRIILFVIGGLTAVFGMLLAGIARGNLLMPDITLNILLAAIYIGLGICTKTRPYTAIVIGIIIYIGTWLYNIVMIGGAGIFSGLIIRVIVISLLIGTVSDAKVWEDAKRKI